MDNYKKGTNIFVPFCAERAARSAQLKKKNDLINSIHMDGGRSRSPGFYFLVL
jgi:hypothetical protein